MEWQSPRLLRSFAVIPGGDMAHSWGPFLCSDPPFPLITHSAYLAVGSSELLCERTSLHMATPNRLQVDG